MSTDVTFIFASCNSQNFAESFTSKTGYSSIGANDYVGPAHYLKGKGSFNTELLYDNSLNAEKGFYLNKNNTNSTKQGKIINIPSIIEKGQNNSHILKSPYSKL